MIIPSRKESIVSLPLIAVHGIFDAYKTFVGNPLATYTDFYIFATTPSAERERFFASRPDHIRAVHDNVIILQID